jgi:thiol:disulfide interchange protein DsbD
MLHARAFGLIIFIVSSLLLTGGADAQGFKPPDRVFQLRVERSENNGIRFNWSIAPGHYLYRERMTAAVAGRSLRLETPPGEQKDDPTFGSTEIYRGVAEASIASKLLPTVGNFIITYQGCVEDKICYPPIHKAIDVVTLRLEDASDSAVKTAYPSEDSTVVEANRDVDPIAATGGTETESTALSGDSLISMLFAFFGFGILLSFTPCVFPMIPILSGMLARSGTDLSLTRSLTLSSAYVTAMAAAYAVLGVFAAWSGDNLQTVLQTPAAIIGMSAVFVLLALSMFGVYELQLPQSWANRLSGTARSKGSVGGAAALGFTSALIVGPCVTPPLAAALVFVAQTGQVGRGSAALFALGMGMGIPLVAFGVLGAKALPRSGLWLVHVKYIFGFIFIGLAIWMLSRVISLRIATAAWGALFAIFGGYLTSVLIMSKRRLAVQFVAAILGVMAIGYGGTLGFAAGFASYAPLQPLAVLGLVALPSSANNYADGFQVVTTERQLDQAIERARLESKTIIVDFSAEWCAECKVMERNVFAQEAVRRELRHALSIRIDLTHFGEEGKALLKRFAIVGPPAVVFLTPEGREIRDVRIVGAVGIDGFLSKLSKALRV